MMSHIPDVLLAFLGVLAYCVGGGVTLVWTENAIGEFRWDDWWGLTFLTVPLWILVAPAMVGVWIAHTPRRRREQAKRHAADLEKMERELFGRVEP